MSIDLKEEFKKVKTQAVHAETSVWAGIVLGVATWSGKAPLPLGGTSGDLRYIFTGVALMAAGYLIGLHFDNKSDATAEAAVKAIENMQNKPS